MCEKHQQNTNTTETESPTLEPVAPQVSEGGCCSRVATATGEPAAKGQDDVAECPVMRGTPVNKAQAEAAGLYRDHNGQRYWFCCAACGPIFDADPDEYAAA